MCCGSHAVGKKTNSDFVTFGMARKGGQGQSGKSVESCHVLQMLPRRIVLVQNCRNIPVYRHTPDGIDTWGLVWHALHDRSLVI